MDVDSPTGPSGLHALARWFLPHASERQMHSTQSLLFTLLLPSLLQLPIGWHLLHYPQHRLPRLIMLPFVVLTAIRCGFSGHVEYTTQSWLNLDLGISAFFTSIRAIWLATKTEAPKYIANDGKPAQPLLLELIGTMRFAGFDIGVPSASEPRWDFIVNRLITSAWCYIGWDILDVAVKHPLVNPATHLGIGSLKICREGPLGLFAEALVFLSVGSIFVYLSIQGSCAFISAISALFVPSTQASWGDLPYIFPLKADSVRALWSTHWHDLFRIMFLDLAFKPTASLARRLGLPRKAQKALGVLAVFTLSGLMHEAGIEGMSWGHADQGWGAGVEGWSYATTKFFVLQGVGVILEDVLQETTGMKVQGWAGRIWAFTWVMGTGWPMIDVWLRHGIIPACPTSWQLSKPLVNAVLSALATWRTS